MLAVTMSQSASHFGPVHKRPKLSLKTSELPVSYSCASQGLTTNVQSISTVTPTTLNTFNNAYDLSIRPSPTSAIEPIKSLFPSRSQSPRPARRGDRPYTLNLPYGVKSILKNSALRNNSVSASPCGSTRKVFFPQPKRVGFRRDLEEDIVTNVYTARHSDLLVHTEDENVVKSIETSGSKTEEEEESESAEENDICLETTKTTISISSIEIVDTKSTSTLTSTSTSVSTPTISTSTPTSRKKRRWEWTLTPIIQEEEGEEDPSTDDIKEIDINEDENDDDWVVVSTESPPSPPSPPTLKDCQINSEHSLLSSSSSKKRRATSLDIDTNEAGAFEPVRKLVKAVSW